MPISERADIRAEFDITVATMVSLFNTPLDFMATYSDPLNLFSTAFDVLAGSIISVCSMSLVTDLDRRASAATIKKIPSVKRPDTSDVDPSKENKEDQ